MNRTSDETPVALRIVAARKSESRSLILLRSDQLRNSAAGNPLDDVDVALGVGGGRVRRHKATGRHEGSIVRETRAVADRVVFADCRHDAIVRVENRETRSVGSLGNQREITVGYEGT